MGNKFSRRMEARVFALVLIAGAVLGGSLPELGNLAAIRMGLEYGHYFNGYFLVAGLLGVVWCGVALYRRRVNKDTVHIIKEDCNGQ